VLEPGPEHAEERTDRIHLVVVERADDELGEPATERRLGCGDERGSGVSQGHEHGSSVCGVRSTIDPAECGESVDTLADRPDPRGEGSGGVRDPRVRVVPEVAEELVLRRHDAVLPSERVTDGVVEARLHADQRIEELDEVVACRSVCHGIQFASTCRGNQMPGGRSTMSREQRQALDETLRAAPQAAGPLPIEQMRQGFAHFMSQFPVPDDVRRTATELGGRRTVRVEPGAEARPGVILYFHGGSFSLGSPETAMALTAHLVRRTRVPALSVDYRLAPEHPFPAAIDDCLSAYRDLLDHEVDPADIVLAGDSAGGGLAVTTTLAARDAGLPVPAGIVAFSPGLDHTRTGASMTSKEGVDPLFTRAAMERTGALYLDGQDPEQPLLAPAVHADLRGFPPMLLQVGTNELLLDDAVRLADRARAAETDVVLDVVAGVPHVFPAFVGLIQEADDAIDRAALFIEQRLRAK
jgi:monoterpene epsilon-lactone hydrolase